MAIWPTFLNVEHEKKGTNSVVRLLGELDLAALDEAKAALGKALGPEGATVLLDIDGLDFIDASGLGWIAAESQNGHRDRLQVTSGRGRVAELLRLTKLDTVLPPRA